MGISHATPNTRPAGRPGAPKGAIWLVGMMGSGKTSVGRRLAERLQRRFIDTDREIEAAAGTSVAEIFEREGESGFRARERVAIEAAAAGSAVVSLGGGAVAQPGVAESLAARGTVVYLRARPETLLRRVGAGETRPLLRGLTPAARLARIRALLGERARHYERAQVVIDTDDTDVETVAREIARRLRNEAASPEEGGRCGDA